MPFENSNVLELKQISDPSKSQNGSKPASLQSTVCPGVTIKKYSPSCKSHETTHGRPLLEEDEEELLEDEELEEDEEVVAHIIEGSLPLHDMLSQQANEPPIQVT